jgi:dTDP-4-dehydrorhamnose reductase
VTWPFVFLTGGTGYLGHEIVACLEEAHIEHRAIGRQEGIDLLTPFELDERWDAMLRATGRDVILIHAAALSRWRECEETPDLAWRANTEATGALASVLHRHGGRMVYVSTDLVFDGEHAPYAEDAPPRPASIYGKSKAGGEQAVLAGGRGLVVRIPLLFGPSFDGKRGASDPVLAALREGREIRLFVDEWRTPLAVRDAAARLVSLAGDETAIGIRHCPGPERLSRYDLGRRIAEEAGLDPSRIIAASRLELAGAPRPADCSLELQEPPAPPKR